MPYIKQERRDYLFEWCEAMHETDTPGDLNYLFSIIANSYINRKGSKYQNFNDVIGALEACKLEFYRRLVVAYEDKKIFENGDIY